MSVTRKIILMILCTSLVIGLINVLVITHYEDVVSDQRDFYQGVVSSVIDYYEHKLNETVEYYEDVLNRNKLAFNGSANMNFSVGSIHARITFYKNGELYYTQYHAGAMTKLGLNITLAKLTGDSWYNLTAYNLNETYISIGNQGSLDSDSKVLPGEWNRTLATVEDEAYNSFNLTCTFYPDASGPYTADCIGINLQSGIGKNDLTGYDTFIEVTGIDETFTITVEFIKSVS